MTRPFDQVAVVGAGTLGAQIALLSAYAGYQVMLYDTRPGIFKETIMTIRSDLQSKNVDPFIPYAQWPACEERIQSVNNLAEAVGAAELVVEVVPENLGLKQQVFQELGRKAPSHAILATNSSSIPVSRLEASSGRPERCLNIHFYMPLRGMNIADVMGGTRTVPEVLDTGIRWVRSLGVIPLTVKKELLGFCFNRVWRAIKREVLHMWAEGFVDFRDIDRAYMVFTGNREDAGPFGLMDRVGLDVVYDIEMVYYKESGDPKDHPPEALRQKVAQGELGVKTGKGFYTYPDPEYLRAGFLDPQR
ncbi:MAG: hypothetical protein JSW39_06205 [Desulfobacterales bacterium]|nr:MAG: hypothetical protein JSW39_06205 [Desulfobacterales bacterium]